jgi:putative restriction endonuclease
LETSLLNPDGSVNSGRGINAVRIITAQEFRSIFQLGVANSELAGDAASPLDVLTGEAPNNDEIVERNSALVSRVIRDAAFTQNVRRAYAGTCAFTGLKIIDTHGRYEVEAAHIRGVSFSGPDSIRNGIALSRTMHWMFDRGAFSIDDDGKILIADKLVPSRIKSMLMPDGYIKFPTEGQMAPHKSFLRFHREKIFAG